MVFLYFQWKLSWLIIINGECDPDLLQFKDLNESITMIIRNAKKPFQWNDIIPELDSIRFF